MSEHRPHQIRPHHLQRPAIVYLRVSTPKQAEEHTGSISHQRKQREYALRWGWAPCDIIEIGDDLGLSGRTGDRKGWQRLLEMVEQGRVGMVLASDASRLTRSPRDLELLLEKCRQTSTLIAVEGVIIDPTDSANLLLLRLLGNFSEFGNDQRTEMCVKGRNAKANEGKAVSPPPTGYVNMKGVWVKDPDPAVRQIIEQVFRQYQAVGSAYRVLQFFVQHQLKLPVRKGPAGLRWVPPELSRIYAILKNPAYAGYYVLGRRLFPGATALDRRDQVKESKPIIKRDHHDAYVTPAEWYEILDRLRGNCTAFRRPAGGRPTGRGQALCQGIIRCGRCKWVMKACYHSEPYEHSVAYVCLAPRVRGGGRCWSVPGRRLDKLVADEVLRGVEPPEIEAIVEAAHEANQRYEAAAQQREAELDRLRYRALVAERLSKETDRDNHRVKATLERDWEQALDAVEQAERRYATEPLKPPLEVTPEILEAIRNLAKDVPALWAAPSTTHHAKKMLLRLFIREVRVIYASQIEFTVAIFWIGGAVSHHTLFQHFAGGIIARQLEAHGLWIPCRSRMSSTAGAAKDLPRMTLTLPRGSAHSLRITHLEKEPPGGKGRQLLRRQILLYLSRAAARRIARSRKDQHHSSARTGQAKKKTTQEIR